MSFHILGLIAPVFGLVLGGYVIRRVGLIGEAVVKGLTNFVFYIAIPVLLFRTVGRNELPGADDLGIIIAYFGATLVVMAAALAVGRILFALPMEQRAVFATGCVYPNGVLLGIPLVSSAFGEEGLGTLFLLISFQGLLLLPPPILIIETTRRKGGGLRGLVSVARSFAENPILLSLAAGLAWAALGWELPEPVESITAVLSEATGPCALFTLGATLAGFRIGGDLIPSPTKNHPL